MTRIITPDGYIDCDELADMFGLTVCGMRRKMRLNEVPYVEVYAGGNRPRFVYLREKALEIAAKKGRSPGPSKGHFELRGGECLWCGCKVDVSDGVCKFCRQQAEQKDYMSLRWR